MTHMFLNATIEYGKDFNKQKKEIDNGRIGNNFCQCLYGGLSRIKRTDFPDDKAQ